MFLTKTLEMAIFEKECFKCVYPYCIGNVHDRNIPCSGALVLVLIASPGRPRWRARSFLSSSPLGHRQRRKRLSLLLRSNRSTKRFCLLGLPLSFVSTVTYT